MKSARNNSLDLLRIICMMMIVALHFFNHGGLVPGTGNWYAGNLVVALCYVAVNCMVLLTGYFQCTSRFKLKRLASVWIQAFFYSVVLYVCAAAFTRSLSVTELIKNAMVATMKRYWYVTAYLLLYAVSPFLNCAFQAMTRRMHLLCCAVLLLIFSVMHNLVYISDFGNVLGGSSFLWFCVLYTVAAYIRLHVPEQSINRNTALGVYFVCAMLIAAERFAAYMITPLIFGRVVLDSFFFSYNSIMTSTASIALFLAMRNVTVNGNLANRWIEFFAPLTFGVYLIHDHHAVRPLLWGFLNPAAAADSVWMLPYGVICITGIFLLCCLIEWVRKWIFRRIGIIGLIEACCDRIQKRAELWLAQ